MEFNNPKYKTRPVLEKNFASNDINLITDSLVSLSLYEKDWRWAQNICLNFLNDPNPVISGLAATCLGHIVRIHHQLDKEKVISALKVKINDPFVSGNIRDALDDIEIFYDYQETSEK